MSKPGGGIVVSHPGMDLPEKHERAENLPSAESERELARGPQSVELQQIERRAVRERWPIPDEKREEMVERAVRMIHSPDSHDQRAGLSTLTAMDKANLERDKLLLQIYRGDELNGLLAGGGRLCIEKVVRIVEERRVSPEEAPIEGEVVNGAVSE